MVCVSGFSGSGKDEFMSRLVNGHGAVQTGLADPAKRHMADLYGWSEEQLFGPSKFRNAGDMSLPKPMFHRLGLMPLKGNPPEGLAPGPYHAAVVTNVVAAHCCLASDESKPYPSIPAHDGMRTYFVKDDDPAFWLSPREALQRYCETMNELYGDTWIRKGLQDHADLGAGGLGYSRMRGLYADSAAAPVSLSGFADFRHIHEFRLTRRTATEEFVSVLVRVKRPSVPSPPYEHRSETEQTRVRDAAFDFLIDNSGTVADLHAAADRVLEEASDPTWSGRPWDESFVLPATSKGYVQ